MQSVPRLSNADQTQCFSGIRANQPSPPPQSINQPKPAARDSRLEHGNVESQSKWIGQRIDQYVVKEQLGGGGMGEVFLAQHRWLDLPVAVKVLRPIYGQDPEAIERFHREAKLVARLNHPNIVKAIDGGPIDSTCYLVTEFLDGMDLEQVIRTSGPMNPSQACWVVCEMAKALDYAHGHGLVHRDIKPQNAMLLRDGSLRILDLGLARDQWCDAATQMTATGHFMGTVDYVSPEQAIDTSSIDHRADIYSLGCTLYFLLTGRPPFHGPGYESVVSKILAHTDEAPESLSKLCRGVPKPVIQTVESMMAKSVDERIQTAAEVLERLGPFAKTIDTSTCFEQKFVPQSVNVNLQEPWMERFSGMILSFLWIVTRTAMSLLGLIERVEIPNPSRIASRAKYRYQVSIKGILAVTVFALIALFIYTNLEVIEVEPPPGSYETHYGVPF